MPARKFRNTALSHSLPLIAFRSAHSFRWAAAMKAFSPIPVIMTNFGQDLLEPSQMPL
jgi:hypothetical protein